MKPRFTPLALAMVMLLGAAGLRAGASTSNGITITLETHPTEVRMGEEFEMTWRVTADNARVLEAFVDCTDAIGPEHSWKHDGAGAFVATMKHKEAEAGFKEYELWAKLAQGDTSRFVGESFQIHVGDGQEDRDLADFLAWMKQAGYSDDVIKVHAHDGTNPKVRKDWEKYFAMRKKDMAYRDMETMPILFVDVMGSDDEAINKPMEGQTDRLESYLAHIYGKAFKVQYEQLKVPYAERFGAPTTRRNQQGHEWLKFNPGAFNSYARETAKRLIEERDLPKNAVIIRWAVKQWKAGDKVLSIEDHTGSGPALSGYDFNGFGLGIYAHEWGHGLGLGHMFVNGPGSYASRIWGLDCIMNHSYVPYANKQVGRLLSPLLRYVLEPKNGFTDQGRFAREYNESMAGTTLLKERLIQTQQKATVASTMAWSTPWSPGMNDSMVVEGLQNRSYKLRKLEVLRKLKPGTYTLVVENRGNSREVSIQRKGKVVASTSIRWSDKTPQTITIGDHLSFEVSGGGNLYGIGTLLNGRRLVVPRR